MKPASKPRAKPKPRAKHKPKPRRHLQLVAPAAAPIPAEHAGARALAEIIGHADDIGLAILALIDTAMEFNIKLPPYLSHALYYHQRLYPRGGRKHAYPLVIAEVERLLGTGLNPGEAVARACALHHAPGTLANGKARKSATRYLARRKNPAL